MLGLMMNSQLTLTAVMQHAGRYHGDAAIVSVTADQPIHRYTYRDCFARAAQLANALLALGARVGDRIGTLAWNDYRHLEVYFGTACMGLVCHTINPRLFPEQIDFIVNHAEDRWLVVDPAFIPLVRGLQGRLPTVEGFVILGPEGVEEGSGLRNAVSYESLLAGQPQSFAWPDLDENTACSLCYTSGTTGNPKGVLYSHRALVLHTYAALMPDSMNLSCREVSLIF